MKKIPFILLLLLIISCGDDQSNRLIKEKNVHVELDSSQYFYLFEIEKHESPNNSKTVPFKGNFVHLTESGSMIAIDQHSFEINEALTEKLNDIYVDDIEFFHDTLLAEKDDEILYFNKSLKWKKYNPYLPIRYFDFLYEDSSYIFTTKSLGEWGGELYIYFKSDSITRTVYHDEIYSIEKYQDNFYFLDYGVLVVFSRVTIANENEIKTFKTKEYVEKAFNQYMDSDKRKYYDMDYYLKGTRHKFLDSLHYFRGSNRMMYSFIKSMVTINGELFFIGNAYPEHKDYKKDRIFKLKPDKFLILDSIDYNLSLPLTVNYNDITTINENKKHFHFLRNDTLFKVEFVREGVEG